MVSMLSSYRSVGNDGMTSQASERCLTQTKSFLEELNLNIHRNYIKIILINSKGKESVNLFVRKFWVLEVVAQSVLRKTYHRSSQPIVNVPNVPGLASFKTLVVRSPLHFLISGEIC